MLADQQFKNTIGAIEIHKLRTGSYPNSFSDINYINQMDSNMFIGLDYEIVDSGYMLNINKKVHTMSGDGTQIKLFYPEDFWTGLGCKQSNTMN